MGGQIAQTIAAAGIPVVLKDIRQELVDAGLAEAAQRHRGPDRPPGQEGQAHRGAGRRAGRRDPRPHRRAPRPTTASATSTSSSRPCPSAWRSSRRSSPSSTRSPRPRDPRLEHLVAVDHRDRRGHAAPRQGRRLPLLLPGVDHAADRDRPGRRHLHGDDAARPSTSPRRSRSSRSPAREVPGFVVNRILNSGIAEVWRDQEERGLSIKTIDEAVGGRERRADGAVLPHRPARPRHRPARRRAPRRLLRRPLLRPRGHAGSWSPTASSAPRPAARASTTDGEPNIAGDAEADGEELAELLALKTFVEAAWSSRRASPRPRHRLRHDGRRRPGPAPRAPAAVHEGRRRGPRRRARAARGPQEQHGERFAPPTILRRLVAQGRLGHEERPGLLRLPAARRRAASRESRQARDPRRRRDRLAGQRPDELDLAAGHRATSARSGRRSRPTACARSSSPRPTRCCSAPAPTSRRSRRWTRPAARELIDHAHALLRELEPRRRDDRRGQRPRLRRRLRAGDGLRRADRGAARRSSASPRSSSGSSPASAAPSGCRGSWARTRRWR